MAEGRSWFYLTLWHGTPPEFTTVVEADIVESAQVPVSIQTMDNASALIEKGTDAVALVEDMDKVGIDIITTTEVIWVVGQ